MAEMVDRVIAAMRSTELDCYDWPQHVMEELARAAIASMREPTDEMEDQAFKEPSVQVYEPEDLTQVLDCVSFKEIWRQMIDEALK